MAELTPIRIETQLKAEIKELIEEGYFTTITEFVKESIRKNLEEYRKQQALKGLAKMKGSLKGIKRLTREERAKAADEALAYKGDIFKDLGLR